MLGCTTRRGAGGSGGNMCIRRRLFWSLGVLGLACFLIAPSVGLAAPVNYATSADATPQPLVSGTVINRDQVGTTAFSLDAPPAPYGYNLGGDYLSIDSVEASRGPNGRIPLWTPLRDFDCSEGTHTVVAKFWYLAIVPYHLLGPDTYTYTFTISDPVPAPTAFATKAALTCGKTVKRGKTLTVTTIMSPRAAGGTVKLTVQYKKGKKWVTAKKVTVRLAYGKTVYKYKVAKRARKGSWRVSASYGGQTTSTAIYRPSSASRSFKVK
jgi:hypothetical protein